MSLLVSRQDLSCLYFKNIELNVQNSINQSAAEIIKHFILLSLDSWICGIICPQFYQV